MNSDKAAAVRDAINGCPEVVGDEDLVERDGDNHRTHSRGTPRTYTGDRLDVSKSSYKPAHIEQCGTLGNGDGAERPVFVVVLETLWTESDEVRSLSPEMVYEIAKHECRIRFYPPEHRLSGDVWVTDHFQEVPTDTNGDRCSCGSTYFKLRDGEPECAKCGESQTETAETGQRTLGEVA